jgi:hypothetical protein
VTTFGSSSDIKRANNQFGFQSISSTLDYTETGNGVQTTPAGILDTENGSVPGNAIYLCIMKNWLFGNDYFKASYDKSSGQTKYVGASLNLPNGPAGPYGSIVGTSGAIFKNYSLRYGKGFAMLGSSMLTPYIEVGNHIWDRGVNYGELYSHNYSGLGILNQYSLKRGMVLSVDVLYGHTSQSAIVVASGGQITGFTAGLGDSVFYRAGVSVDIPVVQGVYLTTGIDYSAFDYGISAASASGLLEPDSRSSYTTFRLGLGLGF